MIPDVIRKVRINNKALNFQVMFLVLSWIFVLINKWRDAQNTEESKTFNLLISVLLMVS